MAQRTAERITTTKIIKLMPISNPIIQGLTVNVSQGSDVTIAISNPTATPTAPKSFWFNVLTSRLYLAIATNSVADWIEIVSNSGNGGTGAIDWNAIANKPSVFPADVAAILDKIVVENNAVLTDGRNVIFEN